jgi:hypothetical protein
MKKTSLFLLALVLLFSGLANAQTIGDYRSVASGNWRTLATWETWDGGTWSTPLRAPGPTNNVLIRNGHTIVFAVSPDSCKNLIVESGALYYCNSTTTNRYLWVYGDSIRNDGVIGGSSDDIGFQCINSVTFTGSGTYQVDRLRAGANGITITFDRNLELHYTGAALYSNGFSNVTYQVNDGDTLSFVGSAYFSFSTSSTGSSAVGGSFYINGTVVMPAGSNFNISVANGVTSLLQVSGNLVLGDTLIADAATTGDEMVIVNGDITYTSTDTMKFDNLYTNNPAGTAFGFPVRINGTLYVGWGDYNNSSGLTIANGRHIRRYTGALTTAPVFEGWVNLEYGPNPAGLALTTGYEIPSADSSVNDVTFNNSTGVILDGDLNCFGSVIFGDGIVTAGSYLLASYGGQPGRTTGYVDGMLGIYVPTGNPSLIYHVGSANGYSPATINFLNVTTAGGVGALAAQTTHPDVSIPENTMQRTWVIGQHPTMPAAFDSCRIEFAYLPGDFNTGFTEATDEGTMVVGKYGGSAWTFPEISVRTPWGIADGGVIEIANVTDFSEFTMGKDQDAIYSAGDITAPYIVSTSPANGATEVALDAAIYIAFSEPMDTLSLAGSMTPSPNEEPAWNATMDTLFLIHDPMTANTSYVIRLTSLTDLAGNPLLVLPDSIMFTTTVGDAIAPYITGISPAWGAIDVGLNDTIVIAFSEPMNTDSLDGYTDPVHDFTVSWNAAGDTFTLVPQNPYPYSTIMSVIITSGIDLAGNSLAFLPDTVVSFTSIPSGVEGKPENKGYLLQLNPAAPNPLTTGTTIRFSLPASAQVSLEVFNVLGQKVNTLADGKLDAGYHTIKWNGTDRNGAKLASGVYIYQLRTMDKTLTKRMTILR